jgi:hypothetical protein
MMDNRGRSNLFATGLLLVCSLSVVNSLPVQTPVPAGVWGGKGLQLTVTMAGATLDYGCDSGSITEPLLADASGAFIAHGMHVFGSGGPQQPNAPPRKEHKSRYEGIREGNTIRVTIVLVDLKRNVGSFTLELGRPASLERCG